MVTFLICVHVVSCLWYITAKLQNFESNTWVVVFGVLDHTPD